MGLHGGTERGEVAEAHGLDELQVRAHRALAGGLAEKGALGDGAEQQLHDGRELVHLVAADERGLVFGAGGGGLLRPRRASGRLPLRSGVRWNDTSLWSQKAGS